MNHGSPQAFAIFSRPECFGDGAGGLATQVHRIYASIAGAEPVRTDVKVIVTRPHAGAPFHLTEVVRDGTEAPQASVAEAVLGWIESTQGQAP